MKVEDVEKYEKLKQEVKQISKTLYNSFVDLLKDNNGCVEDENSYCVLEKPLFEEDTERIPYCFCMVTLEKDDVIMAYDNAEGKSYLFESLPLQVQFGLYEYFNPDLSIQLSDL